MRPHAVAATHASGRDGTSAAVQSLRRARPRGTGIDRLRVAIAAPAATDRRIARVVAVAAIAETENATAVVTRVLARHRDQEMRGSGTADPDAIVSRVRIDAVNDDTSSAAANDRL